jgi:hypothetical protein
MDFRETVAIYSETHMKHVNTLWVKIKSFFNAKALGRYSNHSFLKDYLAGGFL